MHDYSHHTDLLSHFPFPAQPLLTAQDEVLDILIGALRATMGHPEPAVQALAAATLKQVQWMREALRLTALPAPRLELIARQVCAILRVDADQVIKGKRRTQHIAFCRQVAMYLCRKLGDASFPTIGALFDHNHSSVISACQAIERRMGGANHGPLFRQLIDQIEMQITQPAAPTAAAA